MVSDGSRRASWCGEQFNWCCRLQAPEVIRQTGYGRKSDIWSVGCTVIEMVTGKPPWSQHDNPISLMCVRRHRVDVANLVDWLACLPFSRFAIATSQDMPALPESASDELRSFLALCFSRDPSQRPTAAALLRHPFIVGHPSVLSKVTTITDEVDADPESAAVADAAKARGRVSRAARQQGGGAANVVPVIMTPPTPSARPQAPAASESVKLATPSARAAEPTAGTRAPTNPYGRGAGIRSRTSSPPRRSTAATPDTRNISSMTPLSAAAHQFSHTRAPPSASPLVIKPPTHSIAGSIRAAGARESPPGEHPRPAALSPRRTESTRAGPPTVSRTGPAALQSGVIDASAVSTSPAGLGDDAGRQVEPTAVDAVGVRATRAAAASPAAPLLGIHSRRQAEIALIDSGAVGLRSASAVGAEALAGAAAASGVAHSSSPRHQLSAVSGGAVSSAASADVAMGTPPPPLRTLSSTGTTPPSSDANAGGSGAAGGSIRKTQKSGVMWPFSLLLGGPTPVAQRAATPGSDTAVPPDQQGGSPGSSPVSSTTDAPSGSARSDVGAAVGGAAAAAVDSPPGLAPQPPLSPSGGLQTRPEAEIPVDVSRASRVGTDGGNPQPADPSRAEDAVTIFAGVPGAVAITEAPQVVHKVRARAPVQSAGCPAVLSFPLAVDYVHPGASDGGDEHSALAAVRAAVEEDVRAQRSRVQANGDSIARSFDTMLRSIDRPVLRTVSAAQRVYTTRTAAAGGAFLRGGIAGVSDTVIEEGDEDELLTADGRSLLGANGLAALQSVEGEGGAPAEPPRVALSSSNNLAGIVSSSVQPVLSRAPASLTAPLLASISTDSNDDEGVRDAAVPPLVAPPLGHGGVGRGAEQPATLASSGLATSVSTEEAPAAFFVSVAPPPMHVSVSLGHHLGVRASAGAATVLIAAGTPPNRERGLQIAPPADPAQSEATSSQVQADPVLPRPNDLRVSSSGPPGSVTSLSVEAALALPERRLVDPTWRANVNALSSGVPDEPRVSPLPAVDAGISLAPAVDAIETTSARELEALAKSPAISPAPRASPAFGDGSGAPEPRPASVSARNPIFSLGVRTAASPTALSSIAALSSSSGPRGSQPDPAEAVAETTRLVLSPPAGGVLSAAASPPSSPAGPVSFSAGSPASVGSTSVRSPTVVDISKLALVKDRGSQIDGAATSGSTRASSSYSARAGARQRAAASSSADDPLRSVAVSRGGADADADETRGAAIVAGPSIASPSNIGNVSRHDGSLAHPLNPAAVVPTPAGFVAVGPPAGLVVQEGGVPATVTTA